MLNQGRRDDVPLYGRRVIDMSANEVAEATMKAVETIRYSDRIENIHSLAKDIAECTKGNLKQGKREGLLQDIVRTIVTKFEYITFKRRIVPDVTNMIRTTSSIPVTRKDKSVAQWKEIVSAIDKYQK